MSAKKVYRIWCNTIKPSEVIKFSLFGTDEMVATNSPIVTGSKERLVKDDCLYRVTVERIDKSIARSHT